MPEPLGAGARSGSRAWTLRSLAWPAVIAALTAWGVVLGAHGRGGDLVIYVRSAARFLAGAPLYPAADDPWFFKYAPPVALLFAPWTVLPARWAAAAWNLLTVACLAALGPLLRGLLAPAPGEARAPLSPAALAACLVVVGQSLFLELFYGQVDVLMLLLLAASAAACERRRPLTSGAAWALAVAVKPPALLFAAYLARRRPRALAWGVAAGAALWLPVLARYGAGGAASLARAWTGTLERSTAPWVLGSNSQGLPTLVLLAARRAPSPAALGWAQLAAFALLGAALWATRRSPPHLFSAACFAAAFASPLAWRANFVLALPMAALAATDRSRLRGVSVALLAAAAAVQLGIGESVFGSARLERVMLARPFAAAFGALLVWTAARGRASGAPVAAELCEAEPLARRRGAR